MPMEALHAWEGAGLSCGVVSMGALGFLRQEDTTHTFSVHCAYGAGEPLPY